MIVTRLSSNRKIGPVAATYRPVGPTCPRSCPCLPANAGPTNDAPTCYAAQGFTRWVAQSSAEYDHDLSRADGVPAIRHLVSGDWLRSAADGRRVVDRPLLRAVCDWHRAPSQRYTIGWGYTHAPMQLERAGFGPGSAWPSGLEILASCHSHEAADALQNAGWRTARLTGKPGDRVEGEAYCPYDLAVHRGKPPIDRPTCASCRLCWPGQGQQQPNIVFLTL